MKGTIFISSKTVYVCVCVGGWVVEAAEIPLWNGERRHTLR